eukprot:CAMPEP_0119483450 /NCGR_PEP_ID=MMETSP1344-20130328/10857_1 /TAXON_ID=236787 /ORGANISM="Florenciella parvula, Strain CCMP2471" /LENGTH=542 /DNA_ID=CAMNT_0007517949 /DNA_START=54 /DNA_END=1682 /DNA_ORIENTATION=+
MAALDLKKTPELPLVASIFLPTAPHPKTTDDLDFNSELVSCIHAGKHDTVKPLLDELSQARRTAITSLDPSRTLVSVDAMDSDARKYLSLLRGFRGLAIAPGSTGGGAGEMDANGLPVASAPPAPADSLTPAVVAEGGAAEEKSEGAGAAAAADEPEGNLHIPKGGGAVPSLKALSKNKAAGAAEDDGPGGVSNAAAIEAREDSRSLRRMVPFTWRDLGDTQGDSFRFGDTMLEEASVLLALTQVLLQKATAEPLNDQSMLNVFGWLRKAAGVSEACLDCVRAAGAPADEMPDDLKNGLVDTLVGVTMVQAQHLSVRRAQMHIKSNAAITHTLIARICHDTAERYRAMDKKVMKLAKAGAGTVDPKTGKRKPVAENGVAKYFLAHIRYKQLYFMGMAYAMLGIGRVQQDDDEGVAYGIRNLMTATDMFDKAGIAAKAFVDAARTFVFIDNVTIMTALDDCKSVTKQIMEKANKVNQTVFFKPIPEQPDALPDRMSNIKAEPFPDYPIDPMWTNEMYACFNPQNGRKIQCGKVAEDMECCNQQ